MTFRPQARSIQSIVEEQFGRWDVQGKTAPGQVVPPPIITISRETGSIGKFVARRLAQELKMDLSGKSIIDQVAQNAKIRSEVVRTLDEKQRSYLDDLIAAWQDKTNISSDDYFKILVETIGTIGRHGNHIIVGRGGTFILPQPQNLRLRFIAPMEKRVQSLVREYHLTAEEAAHRIKESDHQRRQYIRKYFHADINDPANYDIIINDAYVTEDQAVDMIKAVIKTRNTGK